MPELVDVLSAAVAKGASDVHLVIGKPPMMRIHGEMVPLEGTPALDADETRRMIYSILYEDQRAQFEKDWELDCSFAVPKVSRFRVNVFQQRRGPAAVMRVISGHIPTPQEIGLMPSVVNLTKESRGLVLVTGPTGSGKTTTLASLIETINLGQRKTIVTVEDPIEFAYEDKNSVILQREVGQQTKSFSEALRRSLRQDPDVILVGEMRDLETIQLHQQQQVRIQVSTVLKAVISQILLPRPDGHGRVCAREVMTMTPAVGSLIRDGKTHMLYGAIEAGAKFGMISMDQYLAFLVKQNAVKVDDALSKARDPQNLRMLLSMSASQKP